MDYGLVDRLVEELRGTPEYRAYKRTREIVYANGANAAILSEMKGLQRQMQGLAYMGRSLDDVSQKRLQKLGEVLQFDRDAAAYLMAEYRFTSLLSEVFRRLSAGVGLETVPEGD